MTDTILAWHFVVAERTLRDGRPLLIGEWIEHTSPLVMCESGLHASVKPLDALRYAPGLIACRVECSGEILRESDKLVCSRRRVLWAIDATDHLRTIARRYASDVLHLWDAPQVVRDYLAAGDASLRATAGATAGATAWSAACGAAWATAWAATGAAACGAAWATAWSAACGAAWATAWAATGAAACGAAWATAWSAAGDAWDARDAARAAAWEKYNGWLEEMLIQAGEPRRGA